MSEVLAQLEKKGGGGDYADSYIVQSYGESSANHSGSVYMPSEYFVPKFTQVKYTLLSGSNLRSAKIRALSSIDQVLDTFTISTSWQNIPSSFYQSNVQYVVLINDAKAYDSIRVRFEFR